MGRILDISPLISERIAVWPGDIPFSRELSSAMENGDNLDLSSITATLHLGAHADAPSHYARTGAGMGDVGLAPYVGPCQVVRVSLPRGARILPFHIGELSAPRVLFRTDSFPDAERFNQDFNSLSPELIERLHDQGCVLVGLDTPSVDPFDSKALESHQALARTGLRNLEGLALGHVEPGLYTLIALPLKIEGADASPVRAILMAENP
ncbi:MAG: cyclase family protein [Acidobacteriota bacterium]|nr:cyclase family protein [Acidobacteriota bacterium]